MYTTETSLRIHKEWFEILSRTSFVGSWYDGFSENGLDTRELQDIQKLVTRKGSRRGRVRRYILQSADAELVAACTERLHAACHLFEVSLVLTRSPRDSRRYPDKKRNQYSGCHC